MQDLALVFAGTSASVPTPGRGLPALLVRAGSDRILFDCGEGTQRQLMRAGGLPEIDAIFITHLHADHWLGLPGLLKTFALRERERTLELYGPAGLKAELERFRPLIHPLTYEVTVDELATTEVIPFDDYEVRAFPVEHRGVSLGYALTEDDRPGRFDAERAAQLGVEFGPDFGRLQNGETVNGVRPEDVIGEARQGRKIVISGDTRPCSFLAGAAVGASVLVHESTFVTADAERAHSTGHSTSAQAAQLAAEVDAGLLVLTHVSSRYDADGRARMLDEAREIFERTVMPRDFERVSVPLPEAGAPELEERPRRGDSRNVQGHQQEDPAPSEPSC